MFTRMRRIRLNVKFASERLTNWVTLFCTQLRVMGVSHVFNGSVRSCIQLHVRCHIGATFRIKQQFCLEYTFIPALTNLCSIDEVRFLYGNPYRSVYLYCICVFLFRLPDLFNARATVCFANVRIFTLVGRVFRFPFCRCIHFGGAKWSVEL